MHFSVHSDEFLRTVTSKKLRKSESQGLREQKSEVKKLLKVIFRKKVKTAILRK